MSPVPTSCLHVQALVAYSFCVGRVRFNFGSCVSEKGNKSERNDFLFRRPSKNDGEALACPARRLVQLRVALRHLLGRRAPRAALPGAPARHDAPMPEAPPRSERMLRLRLHRRRRAAMIIQSAIRQKMYDAMLQPRGGSSTAGQTSSRVDARADGRFAACSGEKGGHSGASFLTPIDLGAVPLGKEGSLWPAGDAPSSRHRGVSGGEMGEHARTVVQQDRARRWKGRGSGESERVRKRRSKVSEGKGVSE